MGVPSVQKDDPSNHLGDPSAKLFRNGLPKGLDVRGGVPTNLDLDELMSQQRGIDFLGERVGQSLLADLDERFFGVGQRPQVARLFPGKG